VTWTDTGRATLVIIEANGNGCSNSDTDVIRIDKFPSNIFNILNVGGRSYKFSVIDSLFNSYQWDLGNGTIVNEPTVFYDYNNDYPTLSISLKVTNTLGCIDIFDTVLSINHHTSGIYNHVNIDSVNIFPDPFSNQINVYSNLNSNTTFSIAMYDALGREMITPQKWRRTQGIYLDEVVPDPKKLNPGLYLICLTINEKTIIYKVVHAN